MLNPQYYATLVNQKLAFAKRHLSSAKQLTTNGDIDQKVAFHGQLDSAALQLHRAYEFFLAEIAAEYSLLLDSDSVDAKAAGALLNESQLTIAVWHELKALRKQPGSWLTKLENFYSLPLTLADMLKAQSADNNDDVESVSSDEQKNNLPELIATSKNNNVNEITVSQDANTNPIETIEIIHQQLQLFIERFRSQLVED